MTFKPRDGRFSPVPALVEQIVIEADDDGITVLGVCHHPKMKYFLSRAHAARILARLADECRIIRLDRGVYCAMHRSDAERVPEQNPEQ